MQRQKQTKKKGEIFVLLCFFSFLPFARLFPHFLPNDFIHQISFVSLVSFFLSFFLFLCYLFCVINNILLIIICVIYSTEWIELYPVMKTLQRKTSRDMSLNSTEKYHGMNNKFHRNSSRDKNGIVDMTDFHSIS